MSRFPIFSVEDKFRLVLAVIGGEMSIVEGVTRFAKRLAKRGLGDAACGVRFALGTAAGEGLDEAALAGRERPSCEAGDVQLALERLADPECFQLAAFDLLGDGVAGEEGYAEPFARGPLDRLARVELPGALGPDVSARERTLADTPRARPRFAHEKRLPSELLRIRASVAD